MKQSRMALDGSSSVRDDASFDHNSINRSSIRNSLVAGIVCRHSVSTLNDGINVSFACLLFLSMDDGEQPSIVNRFLNVDNSLVLRMCIAPLATDAAIHCRMGRC